MWGAQPASSDFERLKDEVRDLERRVAALEHAGEAPAPEPGPTMAAAGHAPGFALPEAAPVAGRAILGLAGAYLLRGLAESGVLPREVVAGTAIAYAGGWLWMATRAGAAGARRPDSIAALIYSATAAMILAPLLWESTVRFDLLPHLLTAALLFALPLFSLWLGAATWIIALASSATGVALMIRTGDLPPFAGALILIAAVAELSGVRALRFAVAMSANFAVWLLLWMVRRGGEVPRNIHPVSAATATAVAIALVIVYAGSAARRRQFGIFVLMQIAIGLGLLAYGAPTLASGAVMAVACAGAAAAFRHEWPASREKSLLQMAALPLGVAASLLLLPMEAAGMAWGIAAPALLFAARKGNRILDVHGLVLLGAGAIAAGLPGQALRAAAGAPVDRVSVAALALLAAAVLSCVASAPGWVRATALAFTFAAAATCAIALVAGDDSARSITLRTLVLCAGALAAGLLTARRIAPEAHWISYGMLAACGVKILAVDFHRTSPVALAVSLLCFGAVLIAAPRMTKT